MKFSVFVFGVLLAPLAFSAEPADRSPAFWRAVEGADVHRIHQYPRMKEALDRIGELAGAEVEVFSGYRSQDRQNRIRRSRCGRRASCPGVSRYSAHTHSVAADFRIPGKGNPFEYARTVRDTYLQEGRAINYCRGSAHLDNGLGKAGTPRILTYCQGRVQNIARGGRSKKSKAPGRITASTKAP